jgi:hypothetical protein
MSETHYKAKFNVKDRETQMEIIAGEVVTVRSVIDQENPCVFVSRKGFKDGEAAPISLDVFTFAFAPVEVVRS